MLTTGMNNIQVLDGNCKEISTLSIVEKFPTIPFRLFYFINLFITQSIFHFDTRKPNVTYKIEL